MQNRDETTIFFRKVHEIYGTWRKLWDSYDDFLLNREVFVSRVL